VSSPHDEPFETGAERPPQEPPTVEEAQETAPPAADGPEEAPEVEPEVAAEPVDDLAQAQQALAERTLDLQRLQAEYLNYKRRVDRDRELTKQNAVFSVLNNLLPVLDDIDRAREHGELEGGFKAVADSLERTVTALGLAKFGTPGEEFDPNQHEALMHGLSPDVTTTTVDVVAQAGYRIGDRVVRAARVTVLDPGTTQD
jgi:molecular chaperone GrpE